LRCSVALSFEIPSDIDFLTRSVHVFGPKAKFDAFFTEDISHLESVHTREPSSRPEGNCFVLV